MIGENDLKLLLKLLIFSLQIHIEPSVIGILLNEFVFLDIFNHVSKSSLAKTNEVKIKFKKRELRINLNIVYF